MDRTTELELIDELLALKAAGSAFLDEDVARNPVARYISTDRLKQEQVTLFQQLPNAVAHVSELAEAGSFLRREIGGLPILVTRDRSGGVNAFLNVCRHRGTRLVDEPSGCKHKFSCPYHAWTYSSSGDLIAAPHFEEGFPDQDKADFNLKRLNCVERFGFVWVWRGETHVGDFDAWFDGMADDLEALGVADLYPAVSDKVVRHANWKILVEGGIEAYHFRVAHRTTIGPHFEDNLSSYRSFGAHMRAVLPRTSMKALTTDSRDSWRLRDHANVLYTMFPSSQLLVMQDHIVWIWMDPVAPDRSIMHLSTLAPKPAAEEADAKDAHWKRNHQITMTTLDEDFTIGESIQSSIASGANDDFLFGRFEGALGQLNRKIDEMVGG